MSTFTRNLTDSCQNMMIASDGDGGGGGSSDLGCLAGDIIDDIFDRNLPLGPTVENSDSANSENVSFSTCVSQRTGTSTKSLVDQRLEYWKNMLRERRALQKRIRLATGKGPEAMLVNHPTYIDHRDRKTINRILDLARPKDATQEEGALSAPHPHLEIVGVPEQLADELLGTDDSRKFPRSKWINSKLLEDCIEEQFPNIQKVLEFYPRIKNLEIVRKRRSNSPRGQAESLGSITSSSLIDKPEAADKLNPNLSKPPISTKRNSICSGVCVIINGMQYKPHVPEFSPILERNFCCNPYQHHVRTVMRIENSGSEVIRFTWMRVSAFAYNDTLFQAKDNEFVFDDSAFQLEPGETRDVSVMFQPRMVEIVKQRWLLATHPRFFFYRPCALTLNLNGRCSPPKEYLDRLAEEIANSKRSFAPILLHMTVPLDQQTHHLLCPYDRQLEDREAFNRLNKSFHCSTHSDIEQLKEFFTANTPFRDYPPWDYSVRMLIDLVCDHKDTQKRLLLFGELTAILARLRGKGSTSSRPQECSHTKHIYVRGIIASRIEEWDEKVWQLEEQVLKTTQQQRMQDLKDTQEGDNEEAEGADNINSLRRGLRKLKYFRDSVYIFTYDLLCNAVEDIVSVIESTA